MSTTQEILHRLAASDGYDEAYVLRHQAPSFAEYLRQQLQARGISRAQLIRALCVERAYGYQPADAHGAVSENDGTGCAAAPASGRRGGVVRARPAGRPGHFRAGKGHVL